MNFNILTEKEVTLTNKVTAKGHLVAKKRPMQQTENISVFNCNYKTYFPIMIEREKPRKDVDVEYSRTQIMGGKTTKKQQKIVRDKRYPKNLLVFSNASQKTDFIQPKSQLLY